MIIENVQNVLPVKKMEEPSMDEMRKRVANVSVEDYIKELEKEESDEQSYNSNNHSTRMTRDEWLKTRNTGYLLLLNHIH